MRAVTTIYNLTNRFDVAEKEKKEPMMLSSGATVPDDFERDILCSGKASRNEKEKFISERIEVREHPHIKKVLNTRADHLNEQLQSGH